MEVVRSASLEMLVDSPVIAGEHFRSIPLTDPGDAPTPLDIVADDAESLEVEPATVGKLRPLVKEARRTPGGHWRSRRSPRGCRRRRQSVAPVTRTRGVCFGKDKPAVIRYVVPESPAARAGLCPGMEILALDGRRYKPEVLSAALKTSPQRTEPVEVIAANGDTVRPYRLYYHGGLRYARLERDASKPDLLAQIMAPLVPKPAAPPTGAVAASSASVPWPMPKRNENGHGMPCPYRDACSVKRDVSFSGTTYL